MLISDIILLSIKSWNSDRSDFLAAPQGKSIVYANLYKFTALKMYDNIMRDAKLLKWNQARIKIN